MLGVAAFCLLALGGLPIITRYAFGIAAILAIFCGAGAFGWLLLDRGDPWRRRWAVFGAVVLAVGIAFLPQQARRLDRTRDAIAFQQGVGDDLWTVPLPGCRGLGAVNHRLVPTLALREDLDPGVIDAAPLAPGFRGRYVEPANRRVARGYVLDPRDPSQEVAATPRGFRPAAGERLVARAHALPRPSAVRLLHSVEGSAPGSGPSWSSMRVTHLTQTNPRWPGATSRGGRAVAVAERLAADVRRQQQAGRVVEGEAPAVAGVGDHAHVARVAAGDRADRAGACLASAGSSGSRPCSRAWRPARGRRRARRAGAPPRRGAPGGSARDRAGAGRRRPTRSSGSRCR